MIEVCGLSLARGGACVLRDVSQRVPAGGITAIIGPNGAGKSTLLHCMAGLLRPDAGHVRIGGTDIHQLGEGARARLAAASHPGHSQEGGLGREGGGAFGPPPHRYPCVSSPGRPQQQHTAVGATVC